MPARRLTFALSVAVGITLAACQGHKGSGTVTRSTDSEKTTVTKSDAGSGKLSKVVIKQFSVSGFSEEEAAGVASKFCVEVSKSRKIELICAEDLKTLFQHQQDLMNLGQCDEEDCLQKLASKLEADYILQGFINTVGETFVLNINLVDGPSGKVKARFSQEVTSGNKEDLLGAADSVAEKVRLEF